MEAILHPPSTLLMGPAGTGKTTSLATLIEAGLHVRLLATEPTAPNRVLDTLTARNLPTDKFDWQFVSPAMPGWDALLQSANVVNNMTLKDIADMRGGIARQDGKQWIALLQAMNNFRSDRTGIEYGDVISWDENVAFVIDGLTGVSTMSRNLTVGLKPNPAPGEWGVMQNNILTVFKKLCADCKCFFVCIAHVERETNELTGMSNITVSTLGAKLAPKLPPEFTNVVYAKRNGANFLWSTADTGIDTKSGDLPLSDSLIPSFKPIVESFRVRLKATKPEPQTKELTANV